MFIENMIDQDWRMAAMLQMNANFVRRKKEEAEQKRHKDLLVALERKEQAKREFKKNEENTKRDTNKDKEISDWERIGFLREEQEKILQSEELKERTKNLKMQRSATEKAANEKCRRETLESLAYIALMVSVWNDDIISEKELSHIILSLKEWSGDLTDELAHALVKNVSDKYNADVTLRNGDYLRECVENLNIRLDDLSDKSWILKTLHALAMADMAATEKQCQFLDTLEHALGLDRIP